MDNIAENKQQNGKNKIYHISISNYIKYKWIKLCN